MAEMEKAAYEYSIETEINSLAYDVRMKEVLVEKEEFYLEYSDKKYASDQTRYEMGLISLLDLNSSQNDYQKQIIALSDAENDLISSQNSLKSQVGIDLSEELEFTLDIEKMPFERNYSSKLMEESSMKDIVLYKSYIQDYTKGTFFELTDEAYDVYDKEYKRAYYDAEIARINYEDDYNTFENSFRSDFSELKLLDLKIGVIYKFTMFFK
jgi:hypothetical protein